MDGDPWIKSTLKGKTPTSGIVKYIVTDGKIYEAQYLNGEPHGVGRLIYKKSGNYEIQYYNMGQYVGVWTTYSPDGKIISKEDHGPMWAHLYVLIPLNND